MMLRLAWLGLVCLMQIVRIYTAIVRKRSACNTESGVYSRGRLCNVPTLYTVPHLEKSSEYTVEIRGRVVRTSAHDQRIPGLTPGHTCT
jgi:hypothetical protein